MIFVKFVSKRSAPKWAMLKRAKTKRATTKWSRHKVVYPNNVDMTAYATY